ncbi:D(1B) dopamine receptor [Mactra antiquata]
MDDNSSLLGNTTSAGNIEHGPSPQQLWTSRFIGAVLFFIGFFGVCENILVLRIFYKTKQLRSPTNIFIMGLAISDLCMASLGNPLATTSALYGEWFAGEFMCYWEGFVVYFFGLAELYLLTAISVDRYIVIAKPLKSSIITKRFAVLSVLACFAFGALWAIFPFFGWGSYGLEASKVFCGLLWEDTGASITSYVITIFLFCFIFPMALMIYCYLQIYLTIRHMNKTMAFDKKSRIAKKNMKVERKMLKSCFIMCGVYWLCWTPYSVVSFMQTFGDPHAIPHIMALLPAAAAKSEVVWNPLIYVATNKQFRQAFYATLPCKGLQEKLVKREEEQEQSSKESDLDEKTVVTTQVNQVTSGAAPSASQTQIQTVSINVAAADMNETGPTNVDC